MKTFADLLMIPGPTPLPDFVREAMGRPAIGHRSPEFKEILQRVLPKLSWIFQTRHPVLLYTASATGAMEGIYQNLLNPGDKVLALSCGVFSERWALMAESLGFEVERLTVPAGKANLPEQLREALEQDTAKTIKLVTLNHSETSTGILNPLPELIAEIKRHGALSVVDAVTSLCAAPFDMDGLGIDVAFSGSQKGFMIPPGLSFVAVGERAWEAHKRVKYPGYYFNFKTYQKAQETFTTPYTPATHLIMALDVALNHMEQEGLENIVKRHQTLQRMTRNGLKALGLELFVSEDAYATPSVTAVLPPAGIPVDSIRSTLKKRFGISVADGQKDLKGKIFRVGHLGFVSERDTLTTLACLKDTLESLGYQSSTAVTSKEAVATHG